MTGKRKYLLAAVAAAHMIGGAIAAEQQEGHMHHHRFAPDVDAFHGVLAPVWHAAPGKERSRDACSQAGKMESLAREIRSTDAAQLQSTVATLKKTCEDKKGDVDGALFEVHEAFHRLIEPKKGA